jgi:hypothetical protein
VAAESIVLVWREEIASGTCRWSLRGIREDGTFYGTFERCYGRNGNLEGRFSEEDNLKFHRLVARIREVNAVEVPSDNVVEWRGLLGIGPYSRPEIVFNCRAGDEQRSTSAKEFLELIAILRPLVEPQIRPQH